MKQRPAEVERQHKSRRERKKTPETLKDSSTTWHVPKHGFKDMDI